MTVKLYILAGQSNCVGYALPRDLPSNGYTKSVSSVWFYGKAGWGILRAPTEPLPWSSISATQPTFGAEISLGAELDLIVDGQVAIAKYGVGGTSLAEDWLPSKNKLYTRMRQRVRQGIQDLKRNGELVEVAGFFWIQGEADSTRRDWALRYQANLTQLFSQVRSDFGADLPIVFVQTANGNERMKYIGAVRQAQRRVDIADPLAASVSVADLPELGDRVHLNTQGLLILGDRMATAWDGLQSVALAG